ncbi:FMN-dependent dehydrogenase-domain-containing protein [Chytriomyces sp. MP71]|nr:FMN-dependent dehydrogenase-domain-containing protein [Chytriomyces sp. MP71]
MITHQELATHANAADCWVAIHGGVYNLTTFLREHPGGSKIILKEAGTDATEAYAAYHPKDLIGTILPPGCRVGSLDPASKPVPRPDAAQAQKGATATGASEKPALSQILNSYDFEAIAKQTMKPEAWAYYSSGAEDEITLRENHLAFHRIALKPRVLVNVSKINTSTTLLGSRTRMPIYITACALGKLGHPEGEAVLTRAAGTRGVIQMMPTLASCSMDEMLDARIPGQDAWYQLYVNADRNVTRGVIEKAERRGCKALVVTVDAPQLGRREKDMRLKYEDDVSDIMVKQGDSGVNRKQGAARAISSFIDPSLCWQDIEWMTSITSLPIVLKGIQTGADAVKSAQLVGPTGRGVSGIVVSNHGGRQLDTCRSGIEILPEVVRDLERAGLKGKLEIYVDGGFRRGSDVVKAIALGAKGIGIGRPSLYAMSTYGQAGVEKLLDILEEEMIMVMGLLGVTDLSQITPDLVDATHLVSRMTLVPDMLQRLTYEPLATAAFKSKL